MIIEDRLIRDLAEKSQITIDDYLVIEDITGTKLAPLTGLRRLIMDDLVFNNVEDMKMADLKDGDICITLGYRTVGDGGTSVYKIVYEPTAVEDGANWHYLYRSDVNRAKFISLNGDLHPEQFGAYGDGTKDDYRFLKKCIDTKYKIEFTNFKTYRITKPIELKNKVLIDLNGCTIKPSNCSAFVVSNANTEISIEDVIITNGTIDMSSAKTSAAIKIDKQVKSLTLKDLTIKGGTGSHLIGKGIKKLNVDNCRFSCSEPKAISIDMQKPSTNEPEYMDISIHNSEFINCTRVLSLGDCESDINVIIDTCSAYNTVSTQAASTFVFNNRTSGVINKRSITINKVKTKSFDSILNNQSNDSITIRDVNLKNAKKLFDSSATLGSVVLEGQICLGGDALTDKLSVYGVLAGKLYRHTNAIYWDTNRHKERDASNSNYTCKLYDQYDIFTDDKVKMSLTGDSLAIPFMRNGIIEITNTGSITAITGGIENQVIGLKATNSRSISNSGSIALHSNPTTLSPAKMIYLKCLSGKWTEI